MKNPPFQKAVLVTTGDGEYTVLFEPISSVRTDASEKTTTGSPPQSAIDLFVDGCDKGLPN